MWLTRKFISRKLSGASSESEDMAVVTKRPELHKERGEALATLLTHGFTNCLIGKGKVHAGRLAHVGYAIVPAYALLFGEHFITKIIEDDMYYHSDIILGAIEENKDNPDYQGGLVEGLIEAELKKESVEWHRNNAHSPLRQLLWLKRAIDFVVRFLENSMLIMVTESSSKAARQAYNQVLRAFHGPMLATVVNLGFSLCPSREELVTRLGFPDVGTAQLSCVELIAAARPVLETVDACLKSHGCDFPDKASL